MSPTRRADLVTRIVNDEIVILDRARGQVHRLNATASVVWQDCDGRRTIHEIAASLAAQFGKPAGDVHRDVEAVVASLQELGLLEMTPARESPRP